MSEPVVRLEGVTRQWHGAGGVRDVSLDVPRGGVVARDQLQHAVAEFSTFETARVREGLNNAIQAARTGQTSAEEAFAEAQAAADRLLSACR